MKKTIAIMLALVLCAGALNAQENRKGQWTVGVAGGYAQRGLFNDDSKNSLLTQSYEIGVVSGFMFNSHLGIKAELISSKEYKNDNTMNSGVSGLNLFVAAKYEWQWNHLFVDVVAGPGYTYQNVKNVIEIPGESVNDIHALSLGIEPVVGWRFNEHWGIMLSNRWDCYVYDTQYKTLTDGNDGATFSGGFHATLGVAYTF